MVPMDEKRPRGRPFADVKRDERIQIRVTAEEKRDIESGAPKKEFSEWARGALLRAAKRSKP